MDRVILWIILAAVSGGSVAPFAKFALEIFPPFTLIVIRFFAASLALLPFVYFNKELNLKIFKNLLWMAVVGSFNPILLFIALQFTPASVSPLIYAAIPLMTAVYFQLFRNIRIPAERVLGIVVGFSGVAIIILLPLFQRNGVDIKSLGGNLLILGAAIAFMVYGILSSAKQQQYRISPLALTFYLSVVTLVLAIPISVFELVRQPLALSAIRLEHILSGLETGIIGTALFYIAYQKAIQHGNELTASLFTYLQPIATIVFAVLLIGEKITIPFMVGGVLAILGAQMASAKKPVRIQSR